MFPFYAIPMVFYSFASDKRCAKSFSSRLTYYKGMFRSAGFLVLKVILGHFLIFFEA